MQSFRFSHLKKMFIFLTIIILFVTIKLLDSVEDPKRTHTTEPWVEGTEANRTEMPANNFLKIFHLDLKGGPPKLNYILKILPLIKESGANAILIEYEDMFPFFGRLKNISAVNSYSPKEIKIILEFAYSLKMEVIPLVQTFGHLEYVLKLEEFQHLRESEAFPQEICPSNKEAVDLVKEMIKQIMRAHRNSKYIHIGCDEVRNIGVCPKCTRTNYKTLFANHVIKISNYIKSEYPKVVPLIWDDMLRHWTFNKLDNSGLGTAVEPVVWAYGNIFNLVPPLTWNIYKRIFPTVWIASSFKGAFGETQSLPNLTRHLDNHLLWMEIITKKDKVLVEKPKISGIFITGWSRYDHFAVLCELLPVGIPSLILSLTFLDPEINNNRTVGLKNWLKTLHCPRKYLYFREKDENHFQPIMGNCSFPGSDLYSKMVEYQDLKSRFMKILRKIESGGWTSEYNFMKNFTSPWRLREIFPGEGVGGEILKKDILTWKSSFLEVMASYFDVHTKREWEEQNIKPLERKLDEIGKSFNMLMRRRTWPRRPIG